MSFWIRRYERDFGYKFPYNDRTKAIDSYILMHEIWDRENDCFDIGLGYKGIFCFGSLVILDVARCYLWLFRLYINIEIGKNNC